MEEGASCAGMEVGKSGIDVEVDNAAFTDSSAVVDKELTAVEGACRAVSGASGMSGASGASGEVVSEEREAGLSATGAAADKEGLATVTER